MGILNSLSEGYKQAAKTETNMAKCALMSLTWPIINEAQRQEVIERFNERAETDPEFRQLTVAIKRVNKRRAQLRKDMAEAYLDLMSAGALNVFVKTTIAGQKTAKFIGNLIFGRRDL